MFIPMDRGGTESTVSTTSGFLRHGNDANKIKHGGGGNDAFEDEMANAGDVA